MSKAKDGQKGIVLEELLRAYFLRAGFFVIRGVPISFEGDDLTDVDLWLYERPTGTTRRVQIVDIKYKQRPKAVERLLWTRGLVDALDVDGAYVVTTDKRKNLRKIAKKLDLSIMDGTDLQRIQGRQNILFPERLTDEELVAMLREVDKGRRERELQEARKEIIGSLSDGFGASSVVRSLESFSRLGGAAVSAHPGSVGAVAAGRLAYLAAAITCQSLDYVSVAAAFRSVDERRELLLNAVRYGASDRDEGMRNLRLAVGLIEKYAPNGPVAARAVETGLNSDLDAIPAEIVADQAVRLLKDGQLFAVGRELEAACYSRLCPTFDQLGLHAKSLIGAFLDYASVNREAFASAWNTSADNPKKNAVPGHQEDARQEVISPTLFDTSKS